MKLLLLFFLLSLSLDACHSFPKHGDTRRSVYSTEEPDVDTANLSLEDDDQDDFDMLNLLMDDVWKERIAKKLAELRMAHQNNTYRIPIKGPAVQGWERYANKGEYMPKYRTKLSLKIAASVIGIAVIVALSVCYRRMCREKVSTSRSNPEAGSATTPKGYGPVNQTEAIPLSDV